MTAQILDGKKVAEWRLAQLRENLPRNKRPPGLAVVLVGENPASLLYVKRKQQVCEQLGFYTERHHLEDRISESDLFRLIDALNARSEIDGILVQLPLPSHIRLQALIERIDPLKDVDGFHPYHIGRLVQRHPSLRPCTPAGIMDLLAYYDIPLAGKHAVIVGASTIVGRPMGLELLMANCTVTICHRSTQNLATMVRQADLLVSAMGNPHVIQSEWIKPDAIVVDVGINRNALGQVCGDLDFNTLVERVAWLTPVPGGVGPMTIARLMWNTFEAYQARLVNEN